MTYAALKKLKTNSVSTTISGDITDSAATIPVTELSCFYDADGVLILKGIVLGFNDPVEAYTEEITITGASGTSGAGNLTGATRGVKSDGSIGIGHAWESGTKIAVMLSTGIYDQICDNIAAVKNVADGKAEASHTHAESDVTNLTSDLSGKAADSAVFHKATASEISALTEKTTPVAADLLIIEDSGESNAKKKVQIGNLPVGNSTWTSILPSINTTPASTSTITTLVDLTGFIYDGYALEYAIGGTTYYDGIVTAITSSLITIAGSPLSGTITAISYATSKQVVNIPIVVAGAYADASNTALISTDVRMYGGFYWPYGPAHAVAVAGVHEQNDTGATQPTLNVTIGGSSLLSSALSLSTTRAKSVVNITPANSVLVKDTVIELSVTAGTNGNAYDLTAEVWAVLDA